MTTTADFQHILQEHAGVLVKICRLYTDTEQDFEDYYQEVAIQLWKSYANFRGDSQLSTWVYRVALNVCLSLLKKRKKRPDQSGLPEQMEIADAVRDEVEQERYNKLQQAIKTLKEVDRALILLYLEEKSYQEISDILGMSLSNVGVKINRIKAQLKKKIHG